jgi:hypothetical protein
MGINRGTDRFLPTLNGNVLTTGGSLNLGKGQLGIFDTKNNTKNGLKAVSNFAGAPKNREYEIRVGVAPLGAARTQDSKAKSTRAFKLSEVRAIEAHAPSLKKTVDELLIGYDGINANTALTFEEGAHEVLDITISGEGLGLLGYPNSKETVRLYFEKEEGSTETNQEIVEKAVERLKGTWLKESTPITNLIDIFPTNSEKAALATGGVSHTFYSLSLNGEQDSNGLGDIQAQYNADKVIFSNGSYNILRETADGAPSDYTMTTTSVLQNCDACPGGYDGYGVGMLYNVTLEDDGADLTTTVDNLPGFVAGSVIKQGQNNGVGNYTVVVDNKLTDGEITTFLNASPTATVSLVGDLAKLCIEEVATNFAWVAGDVCYAKSDVYTLQLKDDDCEGNRLAQVQAAYPDLTIIVAQAADGATSTAVTLAGTSGTANVNVKGVDYLATYATSLTVTAANFVTAHAAALAADNVVVTASAGVLTFVDEDTNSPTITVTNATLTLDGTVAATTDVGGDVNGGCQTVYSTTVTTNIVCDECDIIFTDAFSSEAPEAFDFTDWVKEDTVYSETALMGIRIKGKETISAPNESLRDAVPYINSSVRIEAAGGYPTETYNSFKTGRKRFNVKVVSRATELENLGGQLWGLEDRDNTYFNGYARHRNAGDGHMNEYTKQLLGEESLLKPNAQYILYTVSVAPRLGQGAIIPDHVEHFNYEIAVEVGKHQPLEALLNDLAGAAGVEGVQAYGPAV